MFDQAFEWEHAAGSERFILGGGTGSCVDSLHNFKRGFSILSCDYVTWREIFNLEKYRALVSSPRRRSETSANSHPSFHLTAIKDERPFSDGRRRDEIVISRLAPGRGKMENAATRMVRGEDPIRHHVRRKVRHGMMVKPASHTKFLTDLCSEGKS